MNKTNSADLETLDGPSITPTVLTDVLKFLDTLPATFLRSEKENRQALRKIILDEIDRITARNKKYHVCVLASEGLTIIHTTTDEDEAETFIGSYSPPVIRPTFIISIDVNQEIEIREV